MSAKSFLAVMTLLAFLQGPVLPTVFLEGLPLLILLFSEPLSTSLPLAFATGLIFDLVQAQTLGTSSVIFVLFTIFVIFVSSRVPAHHPLVIVFLVFVLNLARGQLVGANHEPLALLIAAFVTAFLVGTRFGGPGKLRV